jgi:hypothetical protein
LINELRFCTACFKKFKVVHNTLTLNLLNLYNGLTQLWILEQSIQSLRDFIIKIYKNWAIIQQYRAWLWGYKKFFWVSSQITGVLLVSIHFVLEFDQSNTWDQSLSLEKFCITLDLGQNCMDVQVCLALYWWQRVITFKF